ncbi:MAG TPA: FRG domain-containing protein [Pyrinomonadaceae bacterium]|nr:FRG domain-containing protein [Pyrinomonadaceae bacterium]
MAGQNQVHHIPCPSADDFLEAISPRSTHLKGAVDRWPHFFVFRGHADDRWQLIPKALRLEQRILGSQGWGSVTETKDSNDTNDSTSLIGSFFYQDNPQATGIWSIKEQVDAEWRMLKRFFEFADMNGLPLPEDSQQLRRLLLETSLILEPAKVEGWPRMEFLSLLALGQHYGLPTRLLDWTRSSFVAAYFAAEEAARKQRDGDKDFDATHLSVWAFNNLKPRLDFQYATREPPWIETVTAPAAGNPNLYAQKGLFTLFRSDRLTEIDRRPIDEILVESKPSRYELFHFTLPVIEAADLLRLLSHQDITGATVYPGYGGAAKAVFEERFF